MTKPKMQMIELEGGRKVAVYRLAEGDTGRTVVFCHAAPGSGVLDPAPEETDKRGITLLAIDRPGYGQSDPLPATEWASVAGAAEDIVQALKKLKIEGPIGAAGWSAGGRVALALAANNPGLVDRVVVMATPAPQEDVPWIPPEQVKQIEQLRGLPAEKVHEIMSEQFAALVPKDAASDEVLQQLGNSPADQEVLALPGVRGRLTEMIKAAFAQGAEGVVEDVAGYTLRDWGFKPEEVKAKTLLLYGAKDPLAGSKHATWYKKRIPDSRIEMSPDSGHMLVFRMWARALSHLAPNAKRKG